MVPYMPPYGVCRAMFSWFATFLRSCLTLARRFWNQFCCHVSTLRLAIGVAGATDIDLVQRHAELGGKVLLDQRARLVLHLEVLLEHVVLLLGQARLHVALRRLLQVRVRGPACVLRRAGRVHGGQHAATLVSRDLGRMHNSTVATALSGGAIAIAVAVEGEGRCVRVLAMVMVMVRRARGSGQRDAGSTVVLLYTVSNAMRRADEGKAVASDGRTKSTITKVYRATAARASVERECRCRCRCRCRSTREDGQRINQDEPTSPHQTAPLSVPRCSATPPIPIPICVGTKITLPSACLLHSPSLISSSWGSWRARSDSRQYIRPPARLLQVDAVTHTLGDRCAHASTTPTSKALCGLQHRGTLRAAAHWPTAEASSGRRLIHNGRTTWLGQPHRQTERRR
jgi:hypothetical protein